MTFDEYAIEARRTAKYPAEVRYAYVALGLVGEAGEIANKVKKIYRDFDGSLVRSGYKGALMDEIGDVLWYVSVLCDEIGVEFKDVAARNLAKLADRTARGVLRGSGDNR